MLGNSNRANTAQGYTRKRVGFLESGQRTIESVEVKPQKSVVSRVNKSNKFSIDLDKRKNLVEKLVSDETIHKIVKKEMIKDLELKSLQREDSIVNFDEDQPQSILKKGGRTLDTLGKHLDSNRFLRDFELR